jgi:hypothetical protein
MSSARKRVGSYRDGPQVLIYINASRSFRPKANGKNHEFCEQNPASQFTPEVQEWLSEQDYSYPNAVEPTRSKLERNNNYTDRRRRKRPLE